MNPFNVGDRVRITGDLKETAARCGCLSVMREMSKLGETYEVTSVTSVIVGFKALSWHYKDLTLAESVIPTKGLGVLVRLQEKLSRE